MLVLHQPGFQVVAQRAAAAVLQGEVQEIAVAHGIILGPEALRLQARPDLSSISPQLYGGDQVSQHRGPAQNRPQQGLDRQKGRQPVGCLPGDFRCPRFHGPSFSFPVSPPPRGDTPPRTARTAYKCEPDRTHRRTTSAPGPALHCNTASTPPQGPRTTRRRW